MNNNIDPELASTLWVIDSSDPSMKDGPGHDSYEHRNFCVIKAVRRAQDIGLTAGYGVDPAEPDYPLVAYINLPTGQVSWHLPPTTVVWDGHTREEKAARIAAYQPRLVTLADLLLDQAPKGARRVDGELGTLDGEARRIGAVLGSLEDRDPQAITWDLDADGTAHVLTVQSNGGSWTRRSWEVVVTQPRPEEPHVSSVDWADRRTIAAITSGGRARVTVRTTSRDGDGWAEYKLGAWASRIMAAAAWEAVARVHAWEVLRSACTAGPEAVAEVVEPDLSGAEEFRADPVVAAGLDAHQTLYRTVQHAWVLRLVADGVTQYRTIDAIDAANWLVLHDHDAAGERIFQIPADA